MQADGEQMLKSEEEERVGRDGVKRKCDGTELKEVEAAIRQAVAT